MYTPCLDCSDRFVNCHSVCEKYGTFRKALEELTEAKNKENKSFIYGKRRNKLAITNILRTQKKSPYIKK